MLKRLALVGTALIKRLDAMEKERIKRGPVPNKKQIIKKFRIMILKSAFQKSLVNNKNLKDKVRQSLFGCQIHPPKRICMTSPRAPTLSRQFLYFQFEERKEKDIFEDLLLVCSIRPVRSSNFAFCFQLTERTRLHFRLKTAVTIISVAMPLRFHFQDLLYRSEARWLARRGVKRGHPH